MDKIVFNEKYNKDKWAIMMPTQKDRDIIENSNLWHILGSHKDKVAYIRILDGKYKGYSSMHGQALNSRYSDYEQIQVEDMELDEEIW